MKRWVCQLVALVATILVGQTARASQVGLADWCFNVNGSVDASSVTDNPSNACNGGTNAALGSLNTSGWDSTLEPSNNTLGSAIVTLGPGSQYAAFYADYDVDFASLGSFNDIGSVHGALPTGWSYELDDPNTSNLFSDFASNTLANTNNVGACSNPSQPCQDVAWALGVGNAGSETVTFTVSKVAPVSGFYLEQTNVTTNDSIFLTATVGGATTSPVPEPSTFFVLLLGLTGVAVAKLHLRRRRS